VTRRGMATAEQLPRDLDEKGCAHEREYLPSIVQYAKDGTISAVMLTLKNFPC